MNFSGSATQVSQKSGQKRKNDHPGTSVVEKKKKRK